ncbi:MAG: release factor glutamine methyltransferase [Blastocatellia bacterium]|jgi:S-adenosylmethionine/arginine decarboxylase-like enzyme|nr:release factor glutamine methyltransferase [Blastocatellia bacterium]
MVIHHQSIIVARVRRTSEQITCEDLRVFLSTLVDRIGMQKLFEPIAIDGKFGFTGIVGIVTSHIAFHFFDSDQSLHFDIYSCKEYDLKAALGFIDEYWHIEKADVLFVERDHGPAVTRFSYSGGILEEMS